MKLIIKHPFEIDVELVDYKPNCLLVKFNWVSNQIIVVSPNEMQTLISFLKFSSTEFNRCSVSSIDETTLSWG